MGRLVLAATVAFWAGAALSQLGCGALGSSAELRLQCVPSAGGGRICSPPATLDTSGVVPAGPGAPLFLVGGLIETAGDVCAACGTTGSSVAYGVARDGAAGMVDACARCSRLKAINIVGAATPSQKSSLNLLNLLKDFAAGGK